MADNISNNKRIAKNTLLLYLRMIFILVVSLYTSRVVLKTLGISDYGVYSVVGGFVSMLAYLNSAFTGASQRFMAFALGKGDNNLVLITFATAKKTHIIIAVILLVIAETFGLWFINNKLVIDAGRMVAANWVYQCSIVTLMITIINIPYNACIIAHEHMHIYAYVSILEVVLKLLILYLLIVLPGDKLIVYAFLQVGISLLMRLIYAVYCRKKFEECRVRPAIDKTLFKEMFSYAGWTALGSLGFTFKDQFSNIIMNGFFGTTINAARGIAMTVNGHVVPFSKNFFVAISPQITKQYASGNLEQSQKLVYAGARYSFLMLSIITIPLIINIDYVLKLWLGTVPEYTSQFVVITLFSSLIYSLTNSTTTAIQATGKIKVFQIGVSIIMLLELPVAYFILKAGLAPHFALVPVLFTNSLALVFRFYLLKRMVPTYSKKKYYINTVLKCVFICALCFLPNYWLKQYLSDNFAGFCISVIVAVVYSGLVIYSLGINKTERVLLKNHVANKLKKKQRFN